MKAGEIKWEEQLCKQCKNCVHVCPAGNLELEKGKIISKNKCTKCGMCIKYCPEGGIEIE